MGNRITFFIMSTNGTPARQISVSKFFIVLLGLIGLGCVAAAGYGAYEWHHLRATAFNNGELEKRIAGQREVVMVQRKQIQQFAEDINNLKDRIVKLNGFEKQIRIIANLEPKEKKSGLFGVGGSTPEDIDPKLSLTEKHNSLIREMNEQMDALHQASGIQELNFKSLITSLDSQKNLLASTPAIWPAEGFVTSDFGNRQSPFTGLTEFHKGLDIAAEKGTPVMATANGKVIFAGKKGAHGNLLIIDHGHGMVTRYAHLSKFLKKVGDSVERGEEVALIGNTGRSTGPHVHYEVRLNGVPVDPTTYILN